MLSTSGKRESTDGQKGLIVSLISLVLFMSYFLWMVCVLHLIPSHYLKAIDLDAVRATVPFYYWLVCSAVALVVVGILVRNVAPVWQKYYKFLAVTSSTVSLAFAGHMIGAFSIACGIVLMSGVMIGLMLREEHLVYFEVSLAMCILFGMTVLSSLGYVKYSTIFIGGPTGSDHPSTEWLVTMLVVILPILSLFFYIARIVFNQRQSYEDKMVEMANIDPLTHINNRGCLMDCFQNELDRRKARSSVDSTVSCIIVDLDHFKNINDSYGHQVGDEALVAVADILKQVTRERDIVGRYGGEEFMMVLPDTDLNTAHLIAERCRKEIINVQLDIDGHRLSMTASFGVSAANTGCLRNDIIKAADKALYKAKESGRNCVVLAEPIREAAIVA